MSAALHVLAPGLLTTVQDFGRPGFQHLGVPVGGALDPISLHAANLLAGNPPDTAGLEVAYLGPTFACEADDVRLALVGARALIEILPRASALEGERIPVGRSFRLRRDEVLRIGALSGGSVLYLAVEGGFAIAPTLGSASTCIRGGFGGWNGRSLEADDCLPLCRNRAIIREEVQLEAFPQERRTSFRAIPGPQDDLFSEEEIAAFFATEYTISAGSDRMGMRLSGRALIASGGFDIVSDAVAPGSIQVPGDGQPIVLLADRQTTGGYPKIATVISADLAALARMPVGAKITFQRVTIETAAAARRELFAEIEALPQRIVPLGRAPSDTEAMHLDANLISGFIDAAA